MIEITKSQDGNMFSQWGEEGAIVDLLSVINASGLAAPEARYLVEFGASRGTDNSNFFRFAIEGWPTLLIEGDSHKFLELKEVTSGMQNVSVLNEWVDAMDNNLAKIVSRAQVKLENVVGVSIDIDGDDALVFENMGISPFFVIVEHNPTLPSEGRFRNPRGKNIGNNLGELLAVAKTAGMFPVCLTETNVIFAKESLRKFCIEIDLAKELQRLDCVRFGWGYDGTLVRFMTSGANTTSELYHNGWADSILFQPLPIQMRKFGGNRTFRLLRKAATFFSLLLNRPITFANRVLRRIK